MTDARTDLDRLLVATDFSEHARNALLRAAMLPCRDDARKLLVHIVAPGEPPEEIDARLDAERAAVPGVWSTEVREARPGAELVELARRERAQLLVVGAKGEDTFKKLLLGSVSERVMRTSSVPVLVVRGAATAPYARALWAVDARSPSHAGYEAARRLGLPKGAIDVAYARRARISVRPTLALIGEGLVGLDAFLDDHHLDVGERLVGLGDPRQYVLEMLERGRYDLLVVGHRHRSTLGWVMLGSVAESLVRLASCDVLVVPEPSR